MENEICYKGPVLLVAQQEGHRLVVHQEGNLLVVIDPDFLVDEVPLVIEACAAWNKVEAREKFNKWDKELHRMLEEEETFPICSVRDHLDKLNRDRDRRLSYIAMAKHAAEVVNAY